jgi:lysophospholipase L1-like esterase
MGAFLPLSVVLTAVLILPCATGCAGDEPSETPPECVPRGGLSNFLGKLHAGGTVRIAYLGGSITKSPGWRTMTVEWFREQHPEATIEGINAGISGTGSDLAVFRLERDVIRHDPDLLFVEFACNDGNTSTERILKSMEGIVRQARRAVSDLDICFVYTLHQGMLPEMQEGKLPRTVRAHETVADHYGIPTILMGREVARLEGEGKLVFTGKWPNTEGERAALGDRILFSMDGAHPYEAGHRLYAEAVARSMKAIAGIGEPGAHMLRSPFRKDNFESARPIPLDRATLSPGWRKLDLAGDPRMGEFVERMEFGDHVADLWVAEKPGESMTVRFRGTSIMLYDVMGPDAGHIAVTIDDKEPRLVLRFDEWCTGHRLTAFVAATDLPNGIHTARFEIHPDQPDKAKILARLGATMDDPKRFDGTTWYVSAVLVTGEVLE